MVRGSFMVDNLFRGSLASSVVAACFAEITSVFLGTRGSELEISFAGRLASSVIAACFAELCTIPLDTAKVRLQLQKKADVETAVVESKYRGMLGTIVMIAREEGVASLWKGIVPGLHRQCLYGGMRIGLYDPVKNLFKKILAGLTTGALAIAIANPTDLVKVRLQAKEKLSEEVLVLKDEEKLSEEVLVLKDEEKLSGTLNVYSTIIKEEGVGALWTGVGPNIARNAIINAAELASYDQVKETILRIPGFSDNVITHLMASLFAGFIAVCFASPVDVVKSRMMGDPAYKNSLDCFIKTLKSEGPMAFFKGFIPNFGRLGSWNVIMFLTLEQVKELFAR